MIAQPVKRLWQAFGLFVWTVVVLGVGAIIGLALAEKGIKIISINYRTKEAWGLSLYEHTTVRLNRAGFAPTPTIHPKPKVDPNAAAQQGGILGLLKRYWWVVLILVVLMTAG